MILWQAFQCGGSKPNGEIVRLIIDGPLVMAIVPVMARLDWLVPANSRRQMARRQRRDDDVGLLAVNGGIIARDTKAGVALTDR